MAVPDEIANNSSLVSSKIRAWTDYLKAGKGIYANSYAELKAFASLNPSEPFLCIATDTGGKILMVYMGDTGMGDNGFITLGGGSGTW